MEVARRRVEQLAGHHEDVAHFIHQQAHDAILPPQHDMGVERLGVALGRCEPAAQIHGRDDVASKVEQAGELHGSQGDSREGLGAEDLLHLPVPRRPRPT